MKDLGKLVGRPLKWVQPHALRMRYELHAGDEIAATLVFRSSFGSFATGESADGRWTFKRLGFAQTRATVRADGADQELAAFKNNTWSGGGTLELPDGRRFSATTNFWQTRLEFRDEADRLLIEFKTGGLLHLSASVEIQPDGHVPELPWMVMLGWYLIVMMQMDAAG